MITTFIVVSSVAMAIVFGLLWLAKPGLRQRVEAPKHLFAEQVRQYDIQQRDEDLTAGAQPNDDA